MVGGSRDDGSDIVSQDIGPAPQGVTDLAQALLVVARKEPQVTLLITDGYENLRPGDAAFVAEGLRRAGGQARSTRSCPSMSRANASSSGG